MIPFRVTCWTRRDAKRPGSEHAANREIGTFLFAFYGFFPALVGP